MAEQASDDEGSRKVVKTKLLILIGAGILLLALGGGAVYFFMGGSSANNSHAEEPAEEVKKEWVEPLYFDVTKPFIVDFPTGSSMQLVQIAVTFIVENEAVIAGLKKNEPMVRNNLLNIISAQTPEILNTTEGKEALRKSMLDEINAILKKLEVHGETKEVLFTSFIMQ